ncbi:MAG: hypothetical protein ACK442_01760 [Novosphingobium sp.]|jgi:hypothetical protein|nr:hypothetical protein [Brevundimonas sp.]
MNRAPLVLIPALLLAACASTPAEYPSLAKRPAERVSGEAMPVPAPVPPPPIDPAVERQIDSLLARARAADAKFRDREGPVRQKVIAAAGAAKASEAWSVAMVALADLDAARSEGLVALADIDAIYAAARIEGAPAIEAKAARDAASALLERQDGVIGDLAGRLAG